MIMEVYGIIMEINPLHNGHLYFLEKAREIAKDNLLVCVISTNVVQRGEFSVLNKTIKTKLLLENGVDIVCELPAVLANQGGEYFALGALKILSNFRITNLIFGSESASIEKLQSDSKLEVSSFASGINSNLGSLQSNDILGISYIRAAKKLNLDLDFNLVKRVANNYNDVGLSSNIASATAIRANLDNPELIAKTLPSESYESICKIDQQLLFKLFKINLDIAIDNQTQIFLSEDNQLLSKMKKVIKEHNPQTLDQFIILCSDKNNSKYKFSRIVINTVLQVTESNYLDVDYLRILGFKSASSKLIPANSFTSLTDCKNEIAKIEARASNLFSLLTNNFQFDEYNRKPLIYKEKNEF